MIQHCCVVSMCRTYFHKSSLVLNQFCFVPRRKFRSQTANNMDRWKSRGEKSQRREGKKKEEKESEESRCRCVKRWKSREPLCFSNVLKSKLPKAAGAEPFGEMRDEKLHAVVARSTFRSQNVQNTPGSEHLLKFSCGKNARRCGAKNVRKSKVFKLRALDHLNLTTSKTKQFCETSSILNLYNIKHEAIHTSFKHGKLSAELTASYQCVLRFSPPSV